VYYLYPVTVVALLISFVIDRKKTLTALTIAGKKFISIAPAFVLMLVLVSVVLFIVPDEMISHVLGNNNNFSGLMAASFFGSITLMPGFVAFPLCGILLGKGVSYMVLSAFTTTLMMVGILTFPLEKHYFGVKVTILRNIMGFLTALVIALSIGFFFDELL